MLDEVIRGGTVIDGTGAPGVRADVGIRDGRVVAVGEVTEEAAVITDATGCYVTPGFVDPHTHYDAQLMWDPAASPSTLHGVTSVVNGNCGFSLAPLRPGDADYLRRMMAQVEGMPLPALETGIDWEWETFADYLNRLEGNLGVNAGFMVGHCAIRRYVMGADATAREADAAELDAIRDELARALEAGGLGFSFTWSTSHTDGEGRPVASRWASADELEALCAETGRHDGTTLEGIVPGCLDQFADDEIELLARLSAAADRPMNWNVLTVDSKVPQRIPRQLAASDRAAELGGRVVALTMPVQVPMNMSLLHFCGLWLLPGWREVLDRPVDERIAALTDPAVRRTLAEGAAAPEAGVLLRLADWATYRIGDTFSDANTGLKGRVVGDVAAERGVVPFEALLDICVADGLRTVLWPNPPDDDDESWAMRAELWDDPRAMIGGSDAGAHLDRMCGAPYPTAWLRDCLHGRRLTSVENAVRLMTSSPASLFGLRDRGVLREGAVADVVVFDPAEIASGEAELVADLPGGSARLTAASRGVRRVLVNGVAVVADGELTGATPGVVLRSGVHTDTVTAR
jgi:N-acyl-D-aspartate/D-glutamate deacylase